MEIQEKVVQDAVTALTTLLKKKDKKDLLVTDTETRVSIQLAFKIVPTQKQTIKIELPTTMVTRTTDVCLFVKDLKKNDRDFAPTIRHYKDLLRNKKITEVTEVIPLKQLKIEYQPHEAKRNLANQFDMFLADERVMRLLPAQLGSGFFKRKRQPSQVNLEAKDLKKEITRALTTARCIITAKGPCCMVAVGHTGLTSSQLSDNVITAAKCLASKIPGGAENVRSMSLKSDNSPSIPIYFSDGLASEIVLPKRQKQSEEVEAEDVTTVIGAKVKVDRFSGITLVGDKRKLETPPGDESDEDENESPPPTKKSKKVSDKNKKGKKKTTDKEVDDSEEDDGELERQYGQKSKKKQNKKQKVSAKAESGSDDSDDENDDLEKQYELKLSAKKKKETVAKKEKQTPVSAKKKKASIGGKEKIEKADIVSTPSKSVKKTPARSAKKKNLEKISGTPKVTPKVKTPKSVKK